MDFESSLRLQPKMLVRRGDCRRLPAPRTNSLSEDTAADEDKRADYVPPKYSPIGNHVYAMEPKGLLRRKCGGSSLNAGGRPYYSDDPLVNSLDRGEFVSLKRGRSKASAGHRDDAQYLDEEILHALAAKQTDDDDDVYDDDDNSEDEDNEVETRPHRGTTQAVYDLDGRRVAREDRDRPWVMKKGGNQHKDRYLIETRYESYLPGDKWYRKKPFTYASNPRWGDAFQIRRRIGKPFRPATQDWLVENDYRIWLFEKSKDRKQLNFPDTVSVKERGYHTKKTRRCPHGTDRSSRRGSDAAPARRKGKTETIQLKYVTGPHRDLYETYNAKKLQSDREREAATFIQKMARGWLYRTRMKKLKRKLFMEHATPYQRFKADYRNLIFRVQKRNGVIRPSAPFDVKQADHFLDRKAKYERAFRSVAVDGRLKKTAMKAFFRECGLNPTQRDINTAYTNVFEGDVGRAEVVFVVDSSSNARQVDSNAQLDFITSIVASLPVGQQHVRVGYLPYNTDILQSFGLGTFDDKHDVIVAIKSIKTKLGVTRTDLALKAMRQMMQEARPRVPKTVVLLTDGRTSRPAETAREARNARADHIVVFAVGTGPNVDKAMLTEVATSPTHVFSVTDHDVIAEIKAQVLRPVPLGDADGGSVLEESGRGLLMTEALELLWTIYPPEATGLDTFKRSTWMKPVVDERETCTVADLEDADFETCLKTVFQSQLERDGEITLPKGEREVERVTKWEVAMQRAREFINRDRMRRDELRERERILAAHKDKQHD